MTAMPFHAGESVAAGGTVGVMGLGNEPEAVGVIRIGVLDNDPFALDAIDQVAASPGLSISTVKNSHWQYPQENRSNQPRAPHRLDRSAFNVGLYSIRNIAYFAINR
ncbi:hypothetical protein [Bifidobacterium miconisargentati]|uniref:hypothetical protein n=1 Tax=Bifidobacterium miconisargentati TaxID=2834437 RepID=UPI001BDDC952|nr:hypothetical protein [Bifidobacterium miconisargentati]MBW3090209.1 hypothetical protein [Bifidobacterium miconisargentati]